MNADQNEITTLNVSLRKFQKEFVQRRAFETGCTTASEYLRRLIYADQINAEENLLEEQLLQAKWEPRTAVTVEEWRRIGSETRAQLTVLRRSPASD